MPLHHYLPATYLARFSTDNNKNRRRRYIFVGNKESGKIFRTRVSKAGAINNFYTLNDERQFDISIDDIWLRYEQELNNAIEELINKKIDALTWARILVPFATCMMIRSPDFNKRFKRRLIELFGEQEKITEDNINSARIFEIQRLIGPIAAAKWIVFKIRENEELITNDIGYAIFKNQPTNEDGISIPLGRKHILGIIPQRKGIIAKAKNNIWYPNIQYGELSTSTDEINRSLASLSQNYIFGSNEIIINNWISNLPNVKMTPEPGEIGFLGGNLARIHEFTWHKLIGVLECKPNSLDAWTFDFKWEKIALGWHPLIILPTNLPVFPTGLQRHKNKILINLYNIEDLSNYYYFILKGKYIM